MGVVTGKTLGMAAKAVIAFYRKTKRMAPPSQNPARYARQVTGRVVGGHKKLSARRRIRPLRKKKKG